METKAQSVFNNGALIKIDNDIIFTVREDVVNKGIIHNHGSIHVGGNWINAGTLKDKGILLFSGNTDQFISNNSQMLNDLVLAGSGNKILIDDLSIDGSLTFDKGKLIVQEGATFKIGANTKIDGVDAQAYIVGKLYRGGSDSLFFPIGTSEEYLPIALSSISGSAPSVGLNVSSSNIPSFDESLGFVSQIAWELSHDGNYSGAKFSVPIPNDIGPNDSQHATIATVPQTENKYTAVQSHIIANKFLSAVGLVTTSLISVGINNIYDQSPPIRVINVVTPFQDGKHDFLRIENIELYEDNSVDIYTSTGTKVFSITNYDNQERVFRGLGNHGRHGALADGNYFYTIRTQSKYQTGFIFLKN